MIPDSLQALNSVLEQPDTDFRSLPFWGWNERMKPEELRRQIADMKDKGLGGAFIHSREGLETPYLSEEWMADVALSADACREAGLDLWIYDEDKWPSGSAGGLVSLQDPDSFTAKGLTLEIRPADGAPVPPGEHAAIIAQTAAVVNGRRLIRKKEGDTLLVLRRERSGASEWYNGRAPSDCLSQEAMDTFIRLTHERYKALFRGELSAHIRGFFTDEPNCYDFFSIFTPGRPWLPWTDDFISQFTARRGYDPTEDLFGLFFDCPGCEKIRHDYWRTVTELFGERCLKTMYDWCEQNHVRFTGHMLYENDLGYNIRVCGAAMPQYRYLHAPGIDILGEQAREYLTVRQASSVARQYNRSMVVSESYGCTGWQFDFEGQKWLGDWQFILGVTHRCQHLMLYSVTGCRKRDYPPVFNYQNTWWQYNRAMEDYFARLGACVSAGEEQRNILVLHPISSLWTKCASSPDEDLGNIEMNMGWKDPHFVALNAEGDRYNRMAEALTRAHQDFDFGDETILSEKGCVEGNVLRVGACRYRAVVIPPITSLFSSTYDLLEAFLAAGGCVLLMGDTPALLEGAPDSRPSQVLAAPSVIRVAEEPALLSALDTLFPDRPRAVSRLGIEDENILIRFRMLGSDALLIAVNHSRTETREVEFRVPVCGSVTAYDPWTNTRRPVACGIRDKGTAGELYFTDTLPPAASVVYMIDTDKPPVRTFPPRFTYAHPHRADKVFATLGPVAPFRRTMPNALTLDRCRFALGDEPLSEETEVWRAQREIRSRLKMPQVYYNGAPQRYTWLESAGGIPSAPFTLSFTFRADELPPASCRFAIEKAEGLEITCNGLLCSPSPGWFIDRGIRLFTLSGLQKGENTILVRGNYTADRELEDVFIIGDFALSPSLALIREPEILRFGDWTLQGYPHYAGGMIYCFTVPPAPPDQRVILRLGSVCGALSVLRINGQEEALLFGSCRREADITAALTAERNTLEIEVVGTPRNLLGPLHQAYDGCARISWEDFRTEGPLYSETPVLKPCGLMSQVILRLEEKEGNNECP